MGGAVCVGKGVSFGDYNCRVIPIAVLHVISVKPAKGTKMDAQLFVGSCAPVYSFSSIMQRGREVGKKEGGREEGGTRMVGQVCCGLELIPQ